jgi:hypothetical protein
VDATRINGAAFNTAKEQKLRGFIFEQTPQPSEKPVFEHYITGEVTRQQDPSLTAKAGQTLRWNARVRWDGGCMKNMRKWMLGAAVVAGGLGLGTTAAQAAEFGIYVRGPVAYVPPCPGAGYAWVAGYQANGYWVPGRWNYVGVRRDDHFARFEGGRDWDRHFDRDRRDWDRGDRGHGDRDHFRR